MLLLSNIFLLLIIATVGVLISHFFIKKKMKTPEVADVWGFVLSGVIALALSMIMGENYELFLETFSVVFFLTAALELVKLLIARWRKRVI